MEGIESLTEEMSALTLRQRLGKAILQMNSQLVSIKSGALVQVWMPEDNSVHTPVLSAQGLPYAVTGVGDLLALFRCVCCRYRFATSPVKPELMGAVGRVFVSCEPEMSHNVQKYDKQVYLRVTDAQRCRVHSTLVMPIFNSASRMKPVAVFELVQSDADVVFPAMMMWLKNALQGVHLFTSELDAVLTSVGLRRWPALTSGPFALGRIRKPAAFAEEIDFQKMDMASLMMPSSHFGESKGVATEEAVADSESELRQPDTDENGHPATSPPGAAGARAASGLARSASAKPDAMSAICGSTDRPSAFQPFWNADSHMFQGFNSSGSNALPINNNNSHQQPSTNFMDTSLQQLMQQQQQVQQHRQQPSGSPTTLQLLQQQLNQASVAQLGTSPIPAFGTAQQLQQPQSQQQMPQKLLDLSSILASQVQDLLGSQAMQSLKHMSQQNGNNLPLPPLGLQSAVAMLINQSAAATSAAATATPAVTSDPATSSAPKPSKSIKKSKPGGRDKFFDDDDEDDLISSGSESEDDGGGVGGRRHGSHSSKSRDKDKDRDSDGDEVFQQIKASLEKVPRSSQPNNRSNGGAGSRLRYEDLQAQFGTGLKEAAANLGICATTLKRACRRVGITRWPRRQIAKFSRALNQMGPALNPVAAAAAAASTNTAVVDPLPLAALMSSPVGMNFASTIAAQIIAQQQQQQQSTQQPQQNLQPQQSSAAPTAPFLPNNPAFDALNSLLMAASGPGPAAELTSRAVTSAQTIPTSARGQDASHSQAPSPSPNSHLLSHHDTTGPSSSSAAAIDLKQQQQQHQRRQQQLQQQQLQQQQLQQQHLQQQHLQQQHLQQQQLQQQQQQQQQQCGTPGGSHMHPMVLLPQPTAHSLNDSSAQQHMSFYNQLASGVPGGNDRAGTSPATYLGSTVPTSNAVSSIYHHGSVEDVGPDSDALLHKMFNSGTNGMSVTLSGLGLSGTTMLMDDPGETMQSHLMVVAVEADEGGKAHAMNHDSLPSLSALINLNSNHHSFEAAHHFLQASLPMIERGMGFESGHSLFADLGMTSEDLLADVALAALVNDQGTMLQDHHSAYSGTL